MARRRPRRFDGDGSLEDEHLPAKLPEKKESFDLGSVRPELVEDAREFAEARHAKNTRKAYEKCWRLFREWCQREKLPFLPAPPQVVALYLSALAKKKRPNGKPYSLATVAQAAAAISTIHQEAKKPSPCWDLDVKAVLKGIRNKLGARGRKARPLMVPHLIAICRWIDKTRSKTRALRDKVLLLTGWAAGLRCSELIALRMDEVKVDDNLLRVFVAKSKTDQAGLGVWVEFPLEDHGRIGQLVAEWIEDAHPGDPFAAKVNKGQYVPSRIANSKIERLVKAGVAAIGLDATKYSSHSMRAGIATYLIYIRKWNPFDVKKHLRHKSVAMLDVYVRDWDKLPKQEKAS